MAASGGGFGFYEDVLFDDVLPSPLTGELFSSYRRSIYCSYTVTSENQSYDMPRLKKFSICYQTNLDEQFIADHFDMLSCGRGVTGDAANIKALNPDIIILGYYTFLMPDYLPYWSYVNQFEEWFVHDKDGNRIHLTFANIYLMNPAQDLTPNEEYHSWSDYFVQISDDFLNNNPQYAGIFADDVAYDLEALGYSWNVPYEDFEEGILDNWSDWLMEHFEILQATLGDDMVMPNGWKYTQICEEITGVHFWEHFIHGRVHDITQPGYSEWYTLFAINTLHETAENGNVIADSNPQKAHQYMLFTMICFLFAVEDIENSYYAWNFYQDDASHGYYPEMDYEFGNPIGDYYNIVGSVYARQFENATVVANISPSSSYTIEIGGNTYQIGSRSGLII